MASYFDQWNSSINRPSHLTDHRFGVSLESGEFVSPLIIPLNAVYIGKGSGSNNWRQWRSHSRSDKGSTVVSNKHRYEISLDVQQFEPNEISVKVNGNNIIVEGNHGEKHDRHGSISRQFVRKYWVSNGYNLNKISSNLSSDGILTVSVTRNDDDNEDRIIPILQTGTPAELQENDREDDKKCDDDKRKEKRDKKLEKEKHEVKWEDKQEQQRDDKHDGDTDEQKQEDEKKD